MQLSWIVARTQARRERWAAENIERQHHEVYFPRSIETTISKGRRIEQIRPLFPSYVFINTTQWYFLRGTFGVCSVIMRGAEPDKMDDSVIRSLKRRENDNGLIELAMDTNEFMIGQQVRIKNGPFKDHLGLYEGQSSDVREKILIDLLGQKVNVTTHVGSLEAV